MSDVALPDPRDPVVGRVLDPNSPHACVRATIAVIVSRTPGVSSVVPAPWWRRGLRQGPAVELPADIPRGALSGIHTSTHAGVLDVEVELCVDLSRPVVEVAEEVRRRIRTAVEQSGYRPGKVGVVVARAELSQS